MVVNGNNVIIYTFRNQLTGKQINLLLDGWSLFVAVIVHQTDILLVGTVQDILSVLQWFHLVIGRITHLYLG